MIELEITYEQLYKLYGNGEHEVPCKVTDNIYVQTPTGFTKINEVVTKHNNEVIRLDFSDGDKFECSVNHIFQDYTTGNPISAVYSKEISSLYGKKEVVEKTPLGIENVYDISIDAPHWYIANKKSGIYHHNTFFALSIVKYFLDNNPNSEVVYFESESAISKKMLLERNIDISRIALVPVTTVQEFRTQVIKIADEYLKIKEKERTPIMFVLDSLGMLSTSKEIEDSAKGSETRDMTRAQVIKSVFRVLTLKLGQAKIPMIFTNHTYDVIGANVPTKEMGGGCLVAGTKIQTENGSIPIENVQIGDKVRTMFGYSPVIDTFEFDDKEVYEMELEDGEKIKCSSDHKFLVDTGSGYEWKRVVELSPLDVIKSM